MPNVPTVSFDPTSPSGGQAISLGDDRIREFKVQVQEILNVDHDVPSSGQGTDWGQHKQVTLQEQADLGTGAVSATLLGSQTVSGKGELVYTDEDDNDIQITSGGKIKLSAGRLENNTNLTARNAADSADVNIVKVNASDKVEIIDGAVLASSAAPTVDAGIANKKYVDDNKIFVQAVNSSSGTSATITTTIPYDDTIPQISEGTEVLSVAITPLATTNKLIIEVIVNITGAITESVLIAALFQDSTANALITAACTNAVNSGTEQLKFIHYMDAGTTSATTFSVRAAANSGNSVVNGGNSSAKFGGTFKSSITITEIKG